jgi:hypothetical protein
MKRVGRVRERRKLGGKVTRREVLMMYVRKLSVVRYVSRLL